MPKVPGMSSKFREFAANTNPGAALSEMREHRVGYGIVLDQHGSPAMLLTLEDFIRAEKTGVETMLHPRVKLRPTIVMPEQITIGELQEHPAVTLLKHGARGAIIVRENKVMGIVAADRFMKTLGVGSLSGGGRTMPFSIPGSILPGTPRRGFGNVKCQVCGYLNKVRSLDTDHLPKCQNPKPPKHTLKP
jgi:hypothetical protein